MSQFFTRTKYDSCASHKVDQENDHAFSLNTDASLQKPTICHPQLSSMGYNGAYGIPTSSKSIDISSELRGQTRLITRCPESRYNPIINCTFCENCDSGLPCGCSHCKESLQRDSCEESLNPSFTRLNKACNIAGITINRFDPLISDIQREAQSLPQSGINTRLQSKDTYSSAMRPSINMTQVNPVQCKRISKWKRCN